jgi:hypothetical protein
MLHRKLRVLFIFAGILIWFEVSSEGKTLEFLLPKDIPRGWALMEGPQTYTKKTLFKHINGQAEIFFKYGFQKSVFGIYQDTKNRENQIELDIYDMGSVLHAFGIFSRFRNEERSIGVGLDSYMDDHSVFFYKSKYFVMLYATESDPVILKEWAKKISSRIVDPSPPPKEISYFPKSGLKLGSIQYFTEGLLGHQFLKRGFQGTYVEKVKVEAEAKTKTEVKDKVEDKDKIKTEGKEILLFLAIFKDSQEAMNALRIYRDELSKKGKTYSGSLAQFGSRALKGEDLYQGQVIVVHKGFYLLGVVGFEKENEGENLLMEFIKNVK